MSRTTYSPYYAFPAFSTRPSLTYSETFAVDPFGPYVFNTTGDPGFSPYLAFDSRRRVPDLRGFALRHRRHQDHQRRVQQRHLGRDHQHPGRAELPHGPGVRRRPAAVFSQWGNALTGWSGKARPAQNATTILAKLGYWTDHVYGYYYYSSELPGVLQQVRTHWESLGVPMGYLQLDSWWYPKGPDASWTDSSDGIYLYEADTTLFPNGLGAFQTSIGVPLVTHARWIDSSSPYHQEYAMSGNVVTDPAYWNNRMSYLAENGVVTYEQDWLGAQAQPAFNLTDRGAFLGNMAAACSANKLDIQYCMPLPKDYMQSTLYNAVTNIRTSNDGFDRSEWDDFLYGSHLAASLGLWPWADVTTSAMTPCVVLQVLSAGPVGVGDEIGTENVSNLQRVAMADGTIVKPDTPIVPNNATYLSDAAAARRRRDDRHDHEHARLDDRRVRLRLLAFQHRERRRFLRAVRSGRDRNGLCLQLLRQHRHRGQRHLRPQHRGPVRRRLFHRRPRRCVGHRVPRRPRQVGLARLPAHHRPVRQRHAPGDRQIRHRRRTGLPARLLPEGGDGDRHRRLHHQQYLQHLHAALHHRSSARQHQHRVGHDQRLTGLHPS